MSKDSVCIGSIKYGHRLVHMCMKTVLKEATRLVEKGGLAINRPIGMSILFDVQYICPQTISDMLEFPWFSDHFLCFKRYSSYFRGQLIFLPLHFNSGWVRGVPCAFKLYFRIPQHVDFEYFHPPSPVHPELSLTPCLVDFYLGSGPPPTPPLIFISGIALMKLWVFVIW